MAVSLPLFHIEAAWVENITIEGDVIGGGEDEGEGSSAG